MLKKVLFIKTSGTAAGDWQRGVPALLGISFFVVVVPHGKKAWS